MADRSFDETSLLIRAQNGDADAFGSIYEHHLERIYRYVYFRLGNVPDAEDVTEHVFLKAWESLPSYRRGENPFVNWLYRIAHNQVIDHHRRHRLIVPMPENEDDRLMSQATPALEQLIEAEQSAALAAAIAKLPDDQQQVIVLRFIQGLNHAEVARILAKSEGACRVIQHRALAALNQLLNSAT